MPNVTYRGAERKAHKVRRSHRKPTRADLQAAGVSRELVVRRIRGAGRSRPDARKNFGSKVYLEDKQSRDKCT
jgi:hypothetical protein